MKDLQRLISLTHSDAVKIRTRQLNGTMSEFYDDEKYLCFSMNELINWKPKKVGRKAKKG